MSSAEMKYPRYPASTARMARAVARWDLPHPGWPRNRIERPRSTKRSVARSMTSFLSTEGWKAKSNSSMVRLREAGEAQPCGQRRLPVARLGGDDPFQVDSTGGSLLGHGFFGQGGEDSAARRAEIAEVVFELLIGGERHDPPPGRVVAGEVDRLDGVVAARPSASSTRPEVAPDRRWRPRAGSAARRCAGSQTGPAPAEAGRGEAPTRLPASGSRGRPSPTAPGTRQAGRDT